MSMLRLIDYYQTISSYFKMWSNFTIEQINFDENNQFSTKLPVQAPKID